MLADQLARMSAGIKAAWAGKRGKQRRTPAARKRTWSDKRRLEMALRTKSRWEDPEYRVAVGAKISRTKKRKGQEPSAETVAASVRSRRENGMSPAVCEIRRQWWLKPGVRERMSEKHRQGILEGRGVYSGRRYPHLDSRGRLWKFRSTWEVRFAQHLDVGRLTWDYEPHRLLLSDGRVYVPDFYVHEWSVYVEVKGYREGKGADKFLVANADGHRVIMIGDIARGTDELHLALARSAQ